VPNFSVSADYYWIKLTDDIVSQLEVGGIGSYTELVRAAPASLPFCTANNVCTTTEVTPVGLASYGVFPYLNASDTKTEGFDVDLQTHFDVGVFGKVQAELNYTHIIEYNVSVAGSTYQLAGTHGPSSISGDTGNPKDRAVLTLSWMKGPATVSATVNYTSHFSITDPSSGISDCASALLYDGRFVPGSATPAYFCDIKTFVDTNIYASYALTDNLTVHGAITNLFNAQAPVDVQTYGGGGGYPYDPSLHQDGAIGRYFLVGAAYKFK
jgi:iron complex outermembrane receptor protein